MLGTYPRRTYASLTCSNQCKLLTILLILAPDLEIIGQDVLTILIFHCQAQFHPTDATQFYLNQKYKLTSKNPLRNTFVRVSLEAKNIIFINMRSISQSWGKAWRRWRRTWTPASCYQNSTDMRFIMNFFFGGGSGGEFYLIRLFLYISSP